MNDDESTEVIAEGIASTVSRAWATVDDGQPVWLAMKTATYIRKFSKEPHDIVKELRILSALSHPNIIEVIDHFRDTSQHTISIWMPFIPHSLDVLLCSPRFSPYAFSPTVSADPLRFETLSKSIIFQTTRALGYLHDRHIAHRDIKPHNVLLMDDGCVKLIDFGIAWKANEPEEEKGGDLWPEISEKLYFEVSTGPYRAPELLFGTRTYNPFAIDLWSLGATWAELYTTLRSRHEEDYMYEAPVHDMSSGALAFDIPAGLEASSPSSVWERDTLFDAMRGEIGLAWSIFQIFGTPTDESWPTFKDLPDAKRVEFRMTHTVPLEPLLPHLPSGAEPLALIRGLLRYPPEERLRTADVLRHQWFNNVLLPGDSVLQEALRESML